MPAESKVPAFWAAVFLVSIPVFFQAPLVRLCPWLSLGLSIFWLLASWHMLAQAHLNLWGDLTLGFTWTWLAGSIYWGWFRWEPLWHLPIEAIGLPLVAICLYLNKAKTGSYFYLGSLLGTAITDLYFYWVDLIPYWRQLMVAKPTEISTVLEAALIHLQTPEAISSAGLLLVLLILLGVFPLSFEKSYWWAFAGAILSTILVDALFFASALFA
jgi:hypothetical protein